MVPGASATPYRLQQRHPRRASIPTFPLFSLFIRISHGRRRSSVECPSLAHFPLIDLDLGQFENPTLRQFNLVTFDHRGCGETGGLIKQDPYRPSHITDDACKIFEALKLPPCHFFGIELGSYVALDLAARHPEWVLSITVCSPSPPVEVRGCWTSTLRN
jgi:pimeloyl-ACP methyl ester carboxylesterase